MTCRRAGQVIEHRRRPLSAVERVFARTTPAAFRDPNAFFGKLHLSFAKTLSRSPSVPSVAEPVRCALPPTIAEPLPSPSDLQHHHVLAAIFLSLLGALRSAFRRRSDLIPFGANIPSNDSGGCSMVELEQSAEPFPWCPRNHRGSSRSLTMIEVEEAVLRQVAVRSPEDRGSARRMSWS